VASGKTTEARASGRTSDRYFALVKELPLRPLRSDSELDRAIAMIDRLLARAGLAGDEEDYLDVLSDLVEKYEDQHFPIEPITGLDALRHLVDSSGKTRATIATEAGLPVSTLSEILLGRRRLNTRHIGILAGYFRIDPGVFLDAPVGSSQGGVRDRSRKTARPESSGAPGIPGASRG
jgi:HTH-type transcriptional regulator/antitoxin HigA